MKYGIFIFRKVKEVKIVNDKEEASRYAVMEDPKASEITFIPSKCYNKQVLSIHCIDPGSYIINKFQIIIHLKKNMNLYLK